MRNDSLASTCPIVLITGASRGIGRAIAVAAAAAGWSVAVHYNTSRDGALATVRDCRRAATSDAQRFELLRADLTKPAQAAALVPRVIEVMGGIDALVNNAGMAPRVRADVLETTTASFDEVMAANLRAAFVLSQCAGRAWVQQAASDDAPRRSVINISSVSATMPSLNRGEYCISKAALAMVTQLFAARLAAHGVSVYELRPGIIDTDMTAPARALYEARIADGLVPQRRWGTPADVARVAVALLRGELAFSTGAVIPVDGGLSIHLL